MRQPLGRDGAEHGDRVETGRLRGVDPVRRVLECADLVAGHVDQLERLEVSVRVRLAVLDVLGREDHVEHALEPGAGDHRLDLDPQRARHDAERYLAVRLAHRAAHVVRHGVAVAGANEVATEQLVEQLGIVPPEPRLHDLRIREPGQWS